MTQMTTPQSGDISWSLAWRLARREMKGSLSKFRIFLSALVIRRRRHWRGGLCRGINALWH